MTARQTAAHAATSLQPAFLFHTAFCCSTLLARALGEPGTTCSLLEPLALRDLADFDRQQPVDESLLTIVLPLLFKSPGGESGVLIKPSNVCNGLAARMLDAMPRARAVVLTSSLREFLVSCAKKPAATRERMPWLLAAVIQGSDYSHRFQVPAMEQLDYWQLCALIWHAQQYRLGELAEREVPLIRMADLLAEPAVVVAGAARHLGLGEPSQQHLAGCLSRHAKDPQLKYGPDQRSAETRTVIERCGPEIERAEQWLDERLPGGLPIGQPLPPLPVADSP